MKTLITILLLLLLFILINLLTANNELHNVIALCIVIVTAAIIGMWIEIKNFKG
jgi:hypothetical protein